MLWFLAPIAVVSIFRRRRPLARAAVVGGVAYHAGKRRSEAEMQEAEQEARLQDLEAQQAYAGQQPAAPSAAPAGGLSPEAMDQLKQLADLHQQGVLTDEEFNAQKAKILGG